MAVYSLRQIAELKGVSYPTIHRYIKKLKEEKKFKKTSPGVFFSESEVQTLSTLLDFTFNSSN